MFALHRSVVYSTPRTYHDLPTSSRCYNYYTNMRHCEGTYLGILVAGVVQIQDKKTCDRSCRLHSSVPTWQHGLDLTDQSSMKDLDHEVGVGDLSAVKNIAYVYDVLSEGNLYRLIRWPLPAWLPKMCWCMLVFYYGFHQISWTGSKYWSLASTPRDGKRGNKNALRAEHKFFLCTYVRLELYRLHLLFLLLSSHFVLSFSVVF